MKKRACIFCLVLALCLCAGACTPAEESQPTEDFTVWLNMNTDYAEADSLPDGAGKPAKVILLLGQSNATGCSLVDYLQKQIEPTRFERLQQGFSNVQINFCLDDHSYTSGGNFVPVDLSCGAGDGYFGPEVGMAEVLAQAYPDEQIFVLKYSMSGYSIHHHWLCQGQRGSIYEAFLKFATTYMEQLLSKGYDAKIGAICWMQGESDTSEFKASHYFDNQAALVSYFREDLNKYSEEGGIYFIDAGISNSPYCEPAYPQINAAKEQYSKTSPMNLYFSTIDAGLTVHLEPEGEPDWGHYDSLSGLKLGTLFGQHIIKSYELRAQNDE